jgi:hypothetical protein
LEQAIRRNFEQAICRKPRRPPTAARRHGHARARQVLFVDGNRRAEPRHELVGRIEALHAIDDLLAAGPTQEHGDEPRIGNDAVEITLKSRVVRARRH